MIYYVNNSAPKNGNGTKEMPFKFINDAAKIAKAGDEVLVASGIYHEYVDPVNGGTEDARIVYKYIPCRPECLPRKQTMRPTLLINVFS